MLTKMRLQLSTTQSIQSYSRATSGYCHRLGTVMYPWEWNSTSVMVTNTLFTLVRLIWKTHLCLLQSFPTFTLKFKPQPVKSGFSVKDPQSGEAEIRGYLKYMELNQDNNLYLISLIIFKAVRGNYSEKLFVDHFQELKGFSFASLLGWKSFITVSHTSRFRSRWT